MSTVNDNLLFQADTTKKYDIPLTHLDYNYIGKCTNTKELERIYKILKSGDEGCYPDLEKYCEDRIELLNPKSRVLRKEAPLGRPGDLPKDEWQQIDVDLQNWEMDMKTTDSGKKTFVDDFDDPELPPIRSGFINGFSAQETPAETTKENKQVTPRDYKEWDKFDIDKELNKMDKEEEKKEEYKPSKAPVIDTNINTAGMTDEEKMMRAGKEKDKGNEAFRAGDYEESISYYTRSIKLHPAAASYNNRAIAHLKTSQWTNASEDCNRVLQIEPANIKALLRRGTAYKGMKEFQKSLVDYQKALQLEPDNKRAQDLIEELQIENKTYEEEKKKRKEKGRRMVIEEVDEESEDEIIVDKKQSKTSTIVNGHSDKLKITEIDEDSEEKNVMKLKKENSRNQKNKVEEENNRNLDKSKADKTNISENEANKADSDIWTEEEVTKKKSESETRTLDSKNTVQGSKKENENRKDFPPATTVNKDRLVEDIKSKPEMEKEQEKIKETLEKEKNGQNNISNGGLERPKLIQGPLLPQVAKLRESGNNLFKTGQYGDAIHKYTQAIEKLEKEKTDQRVNLSLVYSNRAACYLKTGDCPHAVKDCTTSLDLVPHSIKPLLRRANAYEVLERYRPAYADYKHVLSIDHSVDMALQGASRSQRHLTDVDGPKWREKLPRVPSVQSWEIPEIVDSTGTSLNTPVSSQPISIPVTSSSHPVNNSVPSSTQATKQSKPEKSPEEKFDDLKSEGNSYVQKGNFSQAVVCYTQCIDLLPDKAVSYSNRSLCYLKLNKPKEAEEDSTKALSLDKDNVKALFRRAQARKMLKKHKESLEDLNQLLKVDSKNTAAKKEMDIVKGLWREELNNIKKSMEKPRKRIVIEETDSEEEAEKVPVTVSKEQSKPTKSQSTPPKTDTKQSKQSGPSKQSQSTAKESKKDSKHNKQPGTTKQKQPTTAKETKSDTEIKKPETIKTDSEKQIEKQKEPKSKSPIKPTSFGLPQSVPKLEKATPYEFLTAWNSLKQSTDIQPYADLLRQIAPEELPKVISNKLDGGMLSKISKCVAEKFSGDDDLTRSYQILSNVSQVPRFETIAMFMSKNEKKEVETVLSKVQSKGIANKEELTKIRKKYSL